MTFLIAMGCTFLGIVALSVGLLTLYILLVYIRDYMWVKVGCFTIGAFLFLSYVVYLIANQVW